MTDKKTFDRARDTLVPTRDFDHGVVHGKKGQPLDDGEVADLSDDAIRRMTREGGVCEIRSGGKAKAAAAGDKDKEAAKG